eukprot:TRINITY_DN20778_c0_g1_i1.p5 TRINITY_DN20778_c0_g1~~TRINITY_DN20778_c0_g1_i1.p5  ORF type:complete len:102 (+),score=20.83 TRINITY_DN20778_c0_g1_i1:106-411(+)
MSLCFFFFNNTATTEIYTLHIVGSVRCVQETDIIRLDQKKYAIFSQLYYSKASKISVIYQYQFFGTKIIISVNNTLIFLHVIQHTSQIILKKQQRAHRIMN